LLLGFVLFLGTGLLLAGCSILNGTNNGIDCGQTLNQPTSLSSQPQDQQGSTFSQNLIQATPTDPYASINQGAADDADQELNDLQSTLQAVDVTDPASSTDQSLNGTAQGLNDILQTVQAEPTPCPDREIRG
jgi:hypothetical protein